MRRKLLVLSLLVLALTACGDKSQPAAGAAAGGQQMPPPLPVETAKAQMLPLGTGFETVGSLRADESVRQVFDPWFMDDDARDRQAPRSNRQASANEKLHAHHLHVTVIDAGILA